MNSKRNKVRMSGSFRPVLVLMITLASMMSSCVDGDLYDLYDEEDLDINSFIHNKKQSKEGPQTSVSCGICCIAYILSQTDSIGFNAALNIAVSTCNGLHLNPQDPLSIDQIAAILNNCNQTFTFKTRNATVNGVYMEGYFNDDVNNILRTGTYPVIVHNGDYHWVVGRSYQSERTNLLNQPVACVVTELNAMMHNKAADMDTLMLC